MKYVYHSSKIQGLKTIEPNISTHGKSWVYAMQRPECCLMFIGGTGDLVNQTGFVEGVSYIAERFERALECAYKDQSGSIYTLDATDFKSRETSFDAELVCEHSCDVVEEEKIENALPRILALETEGKLVIYRYPNLPEWLPTDKSDIVKKVVGWVEKYGLSELEPLEKFHPDILERVKVELAKKKVA